MISNEMIGPRVRCRHPVLAGGAVHLIPLDGLPLGSAAGGRHPDVSWRAMPLTSRAHVTNRSLATIGVFTGGNAASQNGTRCTPYRKLTLAEAFDIAKISNAFGSSVQTGAARRIYTLPRLPPTHLANTEDARDI